MHSIHIYIVTLSKYIAIHYYYILYVLSLIVYTAYTIPVYIYICYTYLCSIQQGQHHSFPTGGVNCVSLGGKHCI